MVLSSYHHICLASNDEGFGYLRFTLLRVMHPVEMNVDVSWRRRSNVLVVNDKHIRILHEKCASTAVCTAILMSLLCDTAIDFDMLKG